jgi:inorganic pyrophosphatase
MYSELSFIWESWLALLTCKTEEAIENKTQEKSINDYRELMISCFSEAYRSLKPGRWMTVEFSNTRASVWNSIQNALSDAGFIVGNVSVLDKKHGGVKAMTNPTNVKQDLVISAYKPNGGFEERFQKEAQTEEGVWDFVRTHLKYLPVTKRQGVLLLMVPERDPRILFDQMIAFYVRKGYQVPISSQEFQIGLSQRFIERDGMYFLPDQVAEYDRMKMNPELRMQAAFDGFVDGEATAINWLRYQVREKPQTFQEINPTFMMAIGGWSKNEAQLDLRELLNQNFLCYDGNGKIPGQIVSWMRRSSELRPIIEAELAAQGIALSENLDLETSSQVLIRKAADRWYVPDPNKAGDLEKLREKALLKEFEEYKEAKKKLKVFRLEAVRAGFKKAWQDHDYATIIAVADKIPNDVLEEDPKLLMWYDQAMTRKGGQTNA